MRDRDETPPWLEQLPGNAYRFHAAAGGIWRVHDFRLEVDSSNGSSRRRVYRNLGNARAQYRAFVPATGHTWVYLFSAGESRKPDVMNLEKQLRGAQVLGRRPRAGDVDYSDVGRPGR